MGSSGEVDVFSVTQRCDTHFAVLTDDAQERWGEYSESDLSESRNAAQLYYGLCRVRMTLLDRHHEAEVSGEDAEQARLGAELKALADFLLVHIELV